MNDRTISDKPCLQSFAKAKEKQRHPQVKAGCFTFAFAPTHNDDIATTFNVNQDI